MSLFAFNRPASDDEILISAFMSAGVDSIKIVDLKFHLSFKLSWFAPSDAINFIQSAVSKRLLSKKRNVVELSASLREMQEGRNKMAEERRRVRNEAEEAIQSAIERKGFNDYFREIHAREEVIKSFRVLLKNIEIKVQKNPTIVKATVLISETDANIVEINANALEIIHECDNFPDMAINAGKMCRHIAALFRKLQKMDKELAIELIHKLSVGAALWKFSKI